MNKLLSVIIVVLVGFLVFKGNGCGGDNIPKADTVIVRDTAWEIHDSVIVKKMKVKEIIHDTLPPEYIADTNYPALKAQYEELAKAFLAKKIYADTLKLDTLGYIAVADTVQKNELQNRSYDYKYKIPTITNTVTITKQAPAKGALYVGGGVSGEKTNGINSVRGGLLYKTKKNTMFGVHAGFASNQLIYGIDAYWKLK